MDEVDGFMSVIFGLLWKAGDDAAPSCSNVIFSNRCRQALPESLFHLLGRRLRTATAQPERTAIYGCDPVIVIEGVALLQVCKTFLHAMELLLHRTANAHIIVREMDDDACASPLGRAYAAIHVKKIKKYEPWRLSHPQARVAYVCTKA